MRRAWLQALLVAWGACGTSDPPAVPAAGSGSAAAAAVGSGGAAGSGSGSGSAAAAAAGSGSAAAAAAGSNSAAGSGGAGSAAQSGREAMQLVCDAEARSGATTAAPEDRDRVVAQWLRAQVTNAEIARAMEELGAMSRADRQRRIAELARQHGVAPCARVTPPALPFDLPEIPSGGEADDGQGTLVLVSVRDISVEGERLVALDDGALPAPEARRDALARLSRRLQQAAGGPRARVAFAAATPLATVGPVLDAVARAGAARVTLVGRAGELRMVMPLELPGASGGGPDLVVELRADRSLAAWSRSGAFGTRARPAVEAPLEGGLGQLARGLVAIRSRLAAARAPAAVTVTGDDRDEVATLLRVVATVRTVFPRVSLSRGAR